MTQPMPIRYLNCAAMSPWWPRWHLGGVCLVVETGASLTLVDTGLGLHDYTAPSRMVRFFRADFGIHSNPEYSAVRQLSHLGYTPQDVQDIILTHLHFDHAGGLPDFPHARVHVHQREYDALQHHKGLMSLAYDRLDFAHQPSWQLYDQTNAEWLGFKAIRLPFDREIFLIPLFGHTRGHCGVAIRDRDGWLFQCADALPTHAQFDLTPDWLNRLVIGSHVPRLRAFASTHPEVKLIAGHMWAAFFEKVNKS